MVVVSGSRAVASGGAQGWQAPSCAMLNAGSTVFGVFKAGLAHSLCYYEKSLRSEL